MTTSLSTATTPIWSIENHGSFASLHVVLPPGTAIHCESDAVVTFAPSDAVQVTGEMSGGFWSSLWRVFLGGESFFTTVAKNTDSTQPGNVMLAPADPGGIELHELSMTTGSSGDLLLTSGAYVASDVRVNISTELQSQMRNSLLSGTGFFLLRASGQGKVACAAYGAIHKCQLGEGEQRSVDNGHLVAWTATMKYRTGLANARGGMLTSMKSGEGLMCHFTGPGIIYLQSHKPGREAEPLSKRAKREVLPRWDLQPML